MGHIYYITGPSSTGKDTIFKRILGTEELNLKHIVMYTTRPIREGETEGVEYHFVDDAELERLEKSGKVIEKRTYNTVHGLWNYFTVEDKDISLDEQDYLMIGTLESFNKTKEYFGEDKVVPILITVDDGERLQRALNREKGQENPKFKELCRRYLADADDFNQEKIREAGIKRDFKNDDLEECIHEIISYIKEMQA
jgi:guanylate kinase